MEKKKKKMHPVLKDMIVTTSALAITVAAGAGYAIYKFDKFFDNLEEKNNARIAMIDHTLPAEEHPVAKFIRSCSEFQDKYDGWVEKMDEYTAQQEVKKQKAEAERVENAQIAKEKAKLDAAQKQADKLASIKSAKAHAEKLAMIEQAEADAEEGVVMKVVSAPVDLVVNTAEFAGDVIGGTVDAVKSIFTGSDKDKDSDNKDKKTKTNNKRSIKPGPGQ